MKKFQEQFNSAAMQARLTDEERSRMRAAMQMRMEPTASPYFSFHFILTRGFAAALVLIIITGGTAYAAEGALPGDLLYPVKVNAVEPVSGALAFTDTAKAQWHADVAETRLSEAQALAEKGTLTASTSAELGADFTKHARALALITHEANTETDSEAIASRFSSAVAHRGAAILAAGKRSRNDIALRASGDLVVQVASEDTEEENGDTAASAVRTMAAPMMFKASVLSAPASFGAQVQVELTADGLRASLAEATSTISLEGRSDADINGLETRVAAIENLIVKADAERSLGDDADAERHFEKAQEKIQELRDLPPPPPEESGDTSTETSTNADIQGDVDSLLLK